MVQSKFVLSKSGVTFEKPSTSYTGPVEKLFTVLIQADFGLEALKTNATCIQDIYKSRWIPQTASANAVDTL